jgi:hypothetical protein
MPDTECENLKISKCGNEWANNLPIHPDPDSHFPHYSLLATAASQHLLVNGISRELRPHFYTFHH